MKKIKKYKLIVNYTTGLVDRDVNSLIREGYQPYGDPKITIHISEDGKVHEVYSQVMAIYEEDSEEKG